MLKLHEKDTDDIDTGEVLNLAQNVAVQQKINEMSALSFEYPMDEKARLIKTYLKALSTARHLTITGI